MGISGRKWPDVTRQIGHLAPPWVPQAPVALAAMTDILRPRGADWHFVEQREARGRELARRRVGLGIATLVDFARETGVDRKTLARAERGEASENTFLRLESWLDQRETRVSGASGEVSAVTTREVDSQDPDTIRVHVTGPHAEWKILVEGPRGDGDELARLASMVASQVRLALRKD